MSHDVQIDELLSAYLTGDITPDERTAVEQRLAAEPAVRQQLADLQALLALLAQAQRPVTAKMLAELKRRMERANTPTTADLLAAAVTGDVTPTERAAVEQLVAKNETARRELTSLQAMSSFLKQAELSLSKNIGRSLAERLSAKLPAAALAPVLPSADETVAIKLQTSAPTVRIYAVQESPWRKRMLRAAAAIAAAILFAAGAIFGLRALKPESNPDMAKENTPPRQIPQNQSGAVDNGARETNSASIAPDGSSNPGVTDRNGNAVTPPALPRGVQIPNTDVAPVPIAPNAQNSQPPRVNVPVAPKTPHTPAAAPKHAPVNDNGKSSQPAPDVTPEPQHGPAPANTPEPALEPDQKTVADKENTKNGGLPLIQNGGTIVPGNGTVAQGPTPPLSPSVPNQNSAPAPNPPTPEATPPVDNSFVAAVDGKLVAAVLRDGNDAAATTPDGVQTIQLKNELPSDSTITTGNARIAFVLPGDGRLWVNRHTKVTVHLDGVNTTLALQSGEISYRAPHTGNATASSGSLQAYTTGLMDVALDDTQVTMTLCSFDGVTLLKRKGKSTVNLSKQHNEAVAKLDLSDSPAAQSGPATVLLWQQDLNVNGEVNGLVTTSKKDDKTSRSRSRK